MRRLLMRGRKSLRDRVGLSLLLFLCLLPGLPSASAQDVTAVFVAPSSPFITGSRGSLWLYCMNNSSNAVTQTFATSLSGTLKSELISTNTVLLLNTNARDGIRIRCFDRVRMPHPVATMCNFLTQNVSGITPRHSPHLWRRARRATGTLVPQG